MSNILKIAGVSTAAEETDENFNQTVLLLHGDGNQGATNFSNLGPPTYLAFKDNSDNNFPITVNGDAYGSSFGPFSQADGTWSNYFDGTGDYLTVPYNSALTMPAGTDFCIEAWVYKTVDGVVKTIASSYPGATNNNWLLRINASNKLNLYVHPDATVSGAVSTTSVTANQWFHVAATREGTTWRLFVNGNLESTVTATQDVGNANAIYIGSRQDSSTQDWSGYISNYRMVVGSAVYTASFTPSTSPLTAVSGTELLTCQSNRFVDNSTNNFAITVAGNTSVKPFNPFGTTADGVNGSGYFDGTGDYLSVAANSAFLYTGDFTVEMWVYPLVFSDYRFLFGTGGSGVQDQANIYANGTFVYFDGTNSVTSPTLNLNAWNHIAVTRSGTTIRAYANGVSGTSQTISGNLGSSVNAFRIAERSDGLYDNNCYMSNLRVVNGTAVYTGSTYTVPTAPSTAVSGTELLTTQYAGTVRNVGFIDSSPNNFPITRVGNTTQGTFSPFSLAEGQWSAFTNGTAQDGVIRGPDTATLQIEGDDFNLEAWVYLTSYPPGALGGIFSRRTYGSTSGWLFYVNDTGKLIFGGSINGTWQLTWLVSAGTVPLNQWCHVCVSKESTTVRLFINGTLDSNAGTLSTTSSINSPASSVLFAVANTDYNNGTQGPLTGYISNARVIRGTALYTASFTVPTTPLTTTSQGATATEVELLTCQSNRFVDNSDNAFALTTLNTIAIQPFSPFAPSAYSPSVNGGSGYFDGVTDYLYDNTLNTAYDFGSGDFTIEAWLYPQASGIQMMFVNYTPLSGSPAATSFSYFFRITSGNKLGFTLYSGSTGYAVEDTTNITLNTWTHVAVTRESGTVRLFKNGALVDSDTFNVSINASDASRRLQIGTYNLYGQTDEFNGYISNVRIVKGTAVYTSAFTPPTAPLTAITNTSLLLNFTNAGIFDNTGKNVLETVGNAQIDTTVKKYGTGSLEFDGTGDWLKGVTNENTKFGTGDYTIEMWIYPTSSNLSTLFDSRSANPATNGVSIFQHNTDLDVYSDAYDINTSGVLTLNSWQHIAVVRSSGTLTAYVNGVSVGSTSNTDNHTAGRISIGANVANAFPYTGYIDDLRITKGVARYTANFTPPDKAFPDQ